MSAAGEGLLRAVGGVVVLGGLAVLYLLAAERFAERVLAAFGATSERHETIRRIGLTMVALAAIAAGLALAALHWTAPALMLTAAAAQALWRMALRKYLPDADAAAVNGREAARLTLMLFLVATIGVLIVDWRTPEVWRVGGGAWLGLVVGAVVLLALLWQWLGVAHGETGRQRD